MMSESADSLLPSTVPSVVIHTSTFDVGVGLVMAMVLVPVFIGVGGLSSVVSSNDAGAGVAGAGTSIPSGPKAPRGRTSHNVVY